jgi:type IV pilus assembly protein PilX
MRPIIHSGKKTNQGFTLIVGLVFLLMMILIGITAIQTSSLEERMAGNMRDRSLALQSAEMALRAGENDAYTRSTADFASGQAGLYDFANNPHPSPDDPADPNSWGTGTYKSLTFTTPGIASTPMYWIELSRNVKIVSTDISTGTSGSTGDAQILTITAKSTGGSGTAAVVVRSTMKRLTVP